LRITQYFDINGEYRNYFQEPSMSDPSHLSNGRFAPGNPGGPGRPRSAVSAAALALDQAAVDAQAELMRVVLEQARAGNL